MNITRELIQERYKELSADKRHALMSVESAKAIDRIGTDFGLDMQAKGVLADEVGYFILGLRNEEEVKEELHEGLGFSRDEVEEVFGMVDKAILSKIHEAPREERNEKERDEEEDDVREVGTSDPYREPISGADTDMHSLHSAPSVQTEAMRTGGEPPREQNMPKVLSKANVPKALNEVNVPKALNEVNVPRSKVARELMGEVEARLSELRSERDRLEHESNDLKADNMARLLAVQKLERVEEKIEKLEQKHENLRWEQY